MGILQTFHIFSGAICFLETQRNAGRYTIKTPYTMKRQLTLFLLVLAFSGNLQGQVPYQLIFGGGPVLDFEDTSSTRYFFIDTTAANCWQIGTPAKLFF